MMEAKNLFDSYVVLSNIDYQKKPSLVLDDEPIMLCRHYMKNSVPNDSKENLTAMCGNIHVIVIMWEALETPTCASSPTFAAEEVLSFGAICIIIIIIIIVIVIVILLLYY